MPAYRTQDDLITYISKLEERIERLERSAVRVSQTATRASATPSKGRVIYDTSTNKLYAGDGSAWNALW